MPKKLPTTYTTIDGDTWDSVSHKIFGTEFLMDKLIHANPQHQYITVFEAGTTLKIPQLNLPQIFESK